jgi:hypothetical protein
MALAMPSAATKVTLVDLQVFCMQALEGNLHPRVAPARAWFLFHPEVFVTPGKM